MSRTRLLHPCISKSRPATCCLEQRLATLAAGSKNQVCTCTSQYEQTVSCWRWAQFHRKVFQEGRHISVSMPGTICHILGLFFSCLVRWFCCLKQFLLRSEEQLSLVTRACNRLNTTLVLGIWKVPNYALNTATYWHCPQHCLQSMTL